MTTDTFMITPPSQEDVDTHASLEPFKLTPSGRYRANLGTAERHEKCSDTWVAVNLPVTFISDVDGEEVVQEVVIAGREVSASVSTELFERTWDNEERVWIATIGDDGEVTRRTDDNAQLAYGMSYKLLVQLFQALGVLQGGDTDLSVLGFINDLGLLDADALVDGLSGYHGNDIGVQIRNQVQKRKNPVTGKKVVERDDNGKARRESVITDFFAL